MGVCAACEQCDAYEPTQRELRAKHHSQSRSLELATAPTPSPQVPSASHSATSILVVLDPTPCPPRSACASSSEHASICLSGTRLVRQFCLLRQQLTLRLCGARRRVVVEVRSRSQVIRVRRSDCEHIVGWGRWGQGAVRRAIVAALLWGFC